MEEAAEVAEVVVEVEGNEQSLLNALAIEPLKTR